MGKRSIWICLAGLFLGWCGSGLLAQNARKEEAVDPPHTVGVPYEWDRATNSLTALPGETRRGKTVGMFVDLKGRSSASRVSAAYPEFILVTSDPTKFKLYHLASLKNDRQLQLAGFPTRTDAKPPGTGATVANIATQAALGSLVNMVGRGKFFLIVQSREVPLTMTEACNHACYSLRPAVALEPGEYVIAPSDFADVFTFGVDAAPQAQETDKGSDNPPPPIGIPQYVDEARKTVVSVNKESATIQVLPEDLADLEGGRSMFRISSTDKPEFIIRGVSVPRLRLYRFETKTNDNRRRLPMSQGTLSGKLFPSPPSKKKSKINDSEIGLSIVDVCGTNCYRVGPKLPLRPGEYALILHGDDELAFDFFTFGIDSLQPEK